MATRVEIGRCAALIDENAVLTRELASAQARSQRAAGEVMCVGSVQAMSPLAAAGRSMRAVMVAALSMPRR